MTEWLYKQRLGEIAEQKEDFMKDAESSLYLRLADAVYEDKIDAYLALNDLRLELTAKAHGRDLSAEEIKEDKLLLEGVNSYAKEIINPKIMEAYRSDHTNLENKINLIATLGSGISPENYVLEEPAEDLINYINNSVAYYSEATKNEKKRIPNDITKMFIKMISEDHNLDYLSNEENFDKFKRAIETAKKAGLIDVGEINLERILNGNLNSGIPIELIEEFE